MLRQSVLRALRLRAEAAAPARVPQWRHSGSSAPPGQPPPLAPKPPPEEAAKAAEAATDATTAATRAATEAKMGHELSGMLFPWERASFGDRTEGLKWWQKAYWVGFACAMVYLVGEKGYNKATTGKWHGNAPPPKYANKAKPRPTLVKSRVNEALGGASFSTEDDPFEGLSPEEIQAMVAREAPGGDAFDGMTPEEINAYLEREQAERDGHPPAAAVAT